MTQKDGKGNSTSTSIRRARWPQFHAFACYDYYGNYSGDTSSRSTTETQLINISKRDRKQDFAGGGKQINSGIKASDRSSEKNLEDDACEDNEALKRPRRTRNKPALFSEYHQIVSWRFC